MRQQDYCKGLHRSLRPVARPTPEPAPEPPTVLAFYDHIPVEVLRLAAP